MPAPFRIKMPWIPSFGAEQQGRDLLLGSTLACLTKPPVIHWARSVLQPLDARPWRAQWRGVFNLFLHAVLALMVFILLFEQGTGDRNRHFFKKLSMPCSALDAHRVHFHHAIHGASWGQRSSAKIVLWASIFGLSVMHIMPDLSGYKQRNRTDVIASLPYAPKGSKGLCLLSVWQGLVDSHPTARWVQLFPVLFCFVLCK